MLQAVVDSRIPGGCLSLRGEDCLLELQLAERGIVGSEYLRIIRASDPFSACLRALHVRLRVC